MAQHVPCKKVKQIISPNKRIKHKTKGGKKNVKQANPKTFHCKVFWFYGRFSALK